MTPYQVQQERARIDSLHEQIRNIYDNTNTSNVEEQIRKISLIDNKILCIQNSIRESTRRSNTEIPEKFIWE